MKKSKKLKFSISLDQYDHLSEKAVQLQALLSTITGPGFASFAERDVSEQENVLWLAQNLSNEVTQLIRR
ncbi:hypothetical protein PuT2_15065 [Pusillimonas sp. T2]|uniref:hypothetical protein n=1 Tax=Pusillimonas sp. T2 TaxID=1548123 RepID=UPI000B8A751C|nr:hypothetical protein [Pusillimonas sp. T2]OXR47979.1 hypothetical protein PuT2_15065 [Pusillimonas sp. T2]